jgi:CMP-N,N'-diacetyllegionaminic acid synthase
MSCKYDKVINYLGIIPARSGSKGIKNKNIIKINDKECFRYTLEPTIESNVDKIFFSTDSKEYLNLYKKYCNDKDITFDYLRPSNISQSKSSPDEYIQDCLQFLKNKGYTVLNFIILQPTSLFRTSKQINQVLIKHKKNTEINIKSVSPVIQSPYYMMYEDKKPVIKHNFKRRQEHRTTHILNGAYFVNSVENYINNIETYNIFLMTKMEGFDLDEEIDLEIIELLLKKFK